MAEKVRIVYKPDKTVAIMYHTPKSKLSYEETMQKLTLASKLEGLPYDDVEDTTLPDTKEDRNAWEGEKGKGVIVNQVKAKQIKDDKEREPKIQAEMRKLAEESLNKKGE